MSINRRQLLQGFGNIAAAITLSPLSAIRLDSNVYRNSRLRFSIEKPASWHFTSIRDFTSALDEQEEGLSDPSLQQELRELSRDPILVITKYPTDHDGFVPTAAVYANEPTLDPFSTYEELCRAAAYGLESYYPQYEVVQPTRFVNLCGFKAAEFVARYAQEGHERLWPMRMHGLLVHTKSTELYFALVGAPSGPESAADDLRRIRDSIGLW